MSKTPPLSKRAKARRRKIRRDPFGRLALAAGDYLESIGWRAIVIGAPRILRHGREHHTFEFVIQFTGGALRPRKAQGS